MSPQILESVLTNRRSQAQPSQPWLQLEELATPALQAWAPRWSPTPHRKQPGAQRVWETFCAEALIGRLLIQEAQ